MSNNRKLFDNVILPMTSSNIDVKLLSERFNGTELKISF